MPFTPPSPDFGSYLKQVIGAQPAPQPTGVAAALQNLVPYKTTSGGTPGPTLAQTGEALAHPDFSAVGSGIKNLGSDIATGFKQDILGQSKVNPPVQLGPKSEPGYKPPTPKPVQPSLNDYVQSIMAQQIKALGQGNNVNQNLGQYEKLMGQPLGASVADNISSTLQSSISDYQGALASFSKSLPQQAPTEAIITGIKSLLAYPTDIGVPPGVTGNTDLMSLYQTLVNLRNGVGISGSGLVTNAPAASSSTGYGTSAANIVGG